jgi:2-methylcitrate dehydratase PrpD
MARLGTALGWRHYTAGWHATCTAGASAAAVAAATAQGATKAQLATAIALAIPAAGGVQRAFGTAAKALQVGYAAEAGVRAANLAAAGASADPRALDDWIALVQGDPELSPERLAEPQTPAVPGGLAIKLYPCCYALQRPIAALAELHPLDPDDIRKITVTTPEGSLQPLIHKNPQTGLEGKFSLEYGIAAALLDHRPDLNSFEDAAVQRAEAQELIEKVQISPTGGQSNGLLDGEIQVDIELATGESKGTALKLPPGAPERPPTNDELQAKLEACAGDRAEDIASLTWETAQAFLAEL